MAEKKRDFPWERLATSPRAVPRSVRAHVRLAELNVLAPNFSGFLGFFAVIAAAVLIAFGTMWFNLAEEEDYPQAGIPLVAAGVAGFVWLLATIYRRGSRRIQVLQSGHLTDGTITHVWHNVQYYSYEALIGPWRKFFEQIGAARETNPQAGAMSLTYLRMEFSRVPCKVRVPVADGKEREIKMRLDLRRHLLESDTSPRIQVLCDPDRVNDGIAASQLYPWLTLTPDGHWQTATSAGFAVFLTSFFRAALPVIGTYISAAIGITLFGDPLSENLQMKGSPPLLALITVVLTVTHVVGAVFLFRTMLNFLSQFAALIRPGPEGLPLRIFTSVFRCFLWGFIGVWFGAPHDRAGVSHRLAIANSGRCPFSIGESPVAAVVVYRVWLDCDGARAVCGELFHGPILPPGPVRGRAPVVAPGNPRSVDARKVAVAEGRYDY